MRYMFILFMAILLTSCGDNIFENNENKKRSESEESSLETLLNDRKYNQLVNELSLKDLHSLSYREKYIFQMGYMGRAGFDIIKNLDVVFDNSDANLNVIFAVQDDFNNFSDKVSDYDKVIEICSLPADKDMIMACGLSTTMKVVLGVGAVFYTDIPGLTNDCTVSNFSKCKHEDLLKLANKIDTTPEIKNIFSEASTVNLENIRALSELITGGKHDENFKQTIDEIYNLFSSYGTDCSTYDMLSYFKGTKTACFPVGG